MKNNEKNFAVIKVEVKPFKETIFDFIERMISERDKLLKSDCFDFENFVILGDFNERAVICSPTGTKEDALKLFNKSLDYNFVSDAYKFLGEAANAFINEIAELNIEKTDAPITLVEFNREVYDTPETLCEKVLSLNSILSKDTGIDNYVIIANYDDLAIVCRENSTFETLMLQIVENKLPYTQVKHLYAAFGNEVDFVIANFGLMLKEEERAKFRSHFASEYHKVRGIIKNRCKKKEDDKAEKRAVLDDYPLGGLFYLTKDTEKFPKGTKVSVKGKDMLNYVVPAIIVGVGDNLFIVSPTELTKENPEKELSSYIDHTNLKNTAKFTDFETLCEEAAKYNFATVCVPPMFVGYCSDKLNELNASSKVCTVIGFPLGYNTINAKLTETADALANGAEEIDYVLNINYVKMGNWEYIAEEMEAITTLCHEYDNTLCKVIMETCLLTDEEIVKVCEIAKEIGIDYVKTSTGFSTGGATVEAVKLMADTVKGSGVKVKASGGVRTKEDALKMIEAGASRIGTSAGISIVQ